jgi:O-antigen/teichoic acid export membrane protein
VGGATRHPAGEKLNGNDKPAQQANFIKHFFVYGFGVIIMNGISFLFIPIYTRLLPMEDFGILELYNRSQEVLLLLMSFGLRATLLTLYQMEADDRGRNRLYSTALHFLIGTGLLFTFAFFLGAEQFSQLLFGNPGRAIEVRMMLAATFAESLFQVAALYLQSSIQSVMYMTVFITRAIFSVLVNLAFVYWLEWGLKGVLIATLVHTFTYALFLSGYVYLNAGVGFDRSQLIAMLKFGLPLVPGGIIMFFLNNGDRYFLNVYSSAADVGLYGLAYKLGTLVLIIILFPFGKIWSVTMVKLAQRDDGPKALGLVATYLLAVTVFFTVALSVLIPYLLRVATTPAYWKADQVVPIIAAAYVFYSWAGVMDASFYVKKKTIYKPVILGITLVSITILYILLIPRFQSAGAAWATLGGFLVFAFTTLFFAQRVFNIIYEWRRIAILFLLGSAVYFVAGWIPISLNQTEVWPWAFFTMGARSLVLLAFPAVLFWGGFFTADEHLAMRQSVDKARSYVAPVMPWLRPNANPR